MKILFKMVALFVFVLFINKTVQAQIIPFDSDEWEIDAEEFKIGNYFGKEGVYIKNGGALLKDAEFLNGVIEFDVAVTGERGFMGGLWRMLDRNNGESFYIRPHQSGNPDANQYTPIMYGITAWQLYYGEKYAAPVEYKLNEWMHIKIVVSGQYAEIFIMDMSKPALFVEELKREAVSGTVGFYTGTGFAPAYFSDFSYRKIENPELMSKLSDKKMPDQNFVHYWEVSNTFNSETLKDKYIIGKEDLTNLSWTGLKSESTGITNLARLQGRSKNQNTVFAKLVIESDSDQIKSIKFGYSDIVMVYLNGKVIYGGSNFYTSRDYRYLGTIGLFDEVYLNLKKGSNTVLFAVTEYFGGWGIMAAFDNMDNIQIQD